MKKFMRKLRSQAGESIAETLIAVLVIAVALTMLASMITATANMVKRSERTMDAYYTANAALETLSSGEGMTISIKEEGGSELESVPAIYAANSELSETVIAYRMQTG